MTSADGSRTGSTPTCDGRCSARRATRRPPGRGVGTTPATSRTTIMMSVTGPGSWLSHPDVPPRTRRALRWPAVARLGARAAVRELRAQRRWPPEPARGGTAVGPGQPVRVHEHARGLRGTPPTSGPSWSYRRAGPTRTPPTRRASPSTAPWMRASTGCSAAPSSRPTCWGRTTGAPSECPPCVSGPGA